MVIRSALILFTALLAACSSLSSSERAQARLEELDLYMQHAGEPIKSFSFLGRIDEWHSLENDRIVVRTMGRDAYMLKVMGPCTELDSALTVGLTSRGNFVSIGDHVLAGRDRCPITEIRPVDYDAVRAAKREAAAERKAAAAAEKG